MKLGDLTRWLTGITRTINKKPSREEELLAACDELRSACYMLVRYVMIAEAEGADVPSEVVFGLAAIDKAEEVLGDL